MEDQINALIKEMSQHGVIEPKLISDGYHTFAELYEYRMAYHAAFLNELAARGKYDVHKSECHSDGHKCFGGEWFVVVVELPTGQVTNHYHIKDWGKFNVHVKERANKWDGHTPAEGLKRLKEFIKQSPAVMYKTHE